MTLVSGPSTTTRRGPVDTRSSEVSQDATAVYPLTHSQEGIWIDYLANPESTQYNLYLDLDFTKSETDATKPVTAAVIIEGEIYRGYTTWLKTNNGISQQSMLSSNSTHPCAPPLSFSRESHMFKNIMRALRCHWSDYLAILQMSAPSTRFFGSHSISPMIIPRVGTSYRGQRGFNYISWRTTLPSMAAA